MSGQTKPIHKTGKCGHKLTCYTGCVHLITWYCSKCNKNIPFTATEKRLVTSAYKNGLKDGERETGCKINNMIEDLKHLLGL